MAEQTELTKNLNEEKEAMQVGKQASCARDEAPPVPDYEKARKLMAWEEGGEG